MSNPYRFTTIAHRLHLFSNPLSEVRAQNLIKILRLPPHAQIVDIGCGKAELLCRILKHYQARGLGVDLIEAAIEEARKRAVFHGIEKQVQFRVGDAKGQSLQENHYDLALCLGATDAFGSYTETLNALKNLVKPGGLILVGEGFMKQPPNPEYMTFLGASESQNKTHIENIQQAEAQGLALLYSCVANQDEWDHYEGLYAMAIERYVHAHPEDPEGPEFLTKIRRWKTAVQRWGRDTLGLGYYLLLKP